MGVIRFALRMASAAAIALMMVSAAGAAIYPPSRQLPSQVISDFKSAPANLLQQFPDGGAQMISRVRDLGASDPTTLDGLIGLLKNPATTKDQMRAIVAGLAQVARMAAQQDQAYGNEIQTAIAATGIADVIAAYQAATGDVAIAATGAGGTGTGGGGATGTSGFAFGGTNSGASTFGGLHFATKGSTIGSGSVSGTTSSVSPRR